MLQYSNQSSSKISPNSQSQLRSDAECVTERTESIAGVSASRVHILQFYSLFTSHNNLNVMERASHEAESPSSFLD